MEDIKGYILVFLIICILYFFISRLWMGFIDIVLGFLKKIFNIGQKKQEKKWHTIEEIKKNKKN